MSSENFIPHSGEPVPNKSLANRRVGVIVTGGVPHPKLGASTVLMFHYIDSLLAAGATVQVILIGVDAEPVAEELAAFSRAVCRPEDLAIVPIPSPNVLQSHRFSLVDSSVSIARCIQPSISAFGPDSLVCFDIDAAAIGRLVNIPRRLVWLGDLRFQTIWYHALYNVRERSQRVHELAYALVQRRRWQHLYASILKDFTVVVAASDSSVVTLGRLGITARYAPYPWPPLAPPSQPTTPPEQPSFLFFGNLVGLGSRSSLVLLTGGILPKLRRVWGEDGFTIRIAGRETLSPRNRQILAGFPEVEFLGFVDDLATEIRRSHAVLAPIDVPVGNRSRILTALSVGAPVIAHSNAALGNPDLRDGDTCFLARDTKTFVRHMKSCVDDPDTAAAIGSRGHAMYQCRFTPVTAAGLFVELLKGSAEKLPERQSPQ